MEYLGFSSTNLPFHHPRLPQKNSSSVTVLKRLDNRKLNKIETTEDINQSTPRALTVAISGCTSSGKTTLALLLSEIFSAFSSKNKSTENSSSRESEKDNLGNSQAITPFTTTIHQDSFFIPKADCPFVQFNSTNNDKKFVKESIAQKDEKPVYTYSCTGTKGEGIVQVVGPNTDCIEAVNFSNLLREVQATHIKKIEPQKITRFKEDADKKKLVEQYSGVIASMRKKIKEHRALTTIKQASRYGENVAGNINGWVFVEGFLLFSKSKPPDHGSLEFLENTGKPSAEVPEDLQMIAKKDFTFMEKELTRMKEESTLSKEALMEEFDIKLFLPTSKDVAKQRRMSRFPYVDFPAGGRHPGQMWKSEGYFDEVVWKGYEDSFSWLLKETGKECINGVFVRTTVDDTVENTVEWAVDIILDFLTSWEMNQEGILGN
ncbi:f7c36df7-a3db-44b9-80e7-82873dcce956 [Sclerotinia trifoliorum]|uniref:F7c36df7-a3db-44b9-80e7-82873dcce956 n=1 Tax=Sclerotinia trifoliorum TaxID=28548 RepID=A0A8H2W2I8_9HELO|nr:f7c36df7-a3db-44b9-80e7-82873dcce956 [Sclerotinia trifoliorum]